MAKLKFISPEFSDGEPIPKKYGYKRENINPPLRFYRVPEETESLVLIMDDPDAVEPAGKVWDHWVVWNISPDTTSIEEDSVPKGATEGKNDYGSNGYGGPNPPDKEHTYHFKLYALDTELDLPPSSTKDDVRKAIKGHIIAKAKHTGTFIPL
ncbi:MAG: YbhB/YbcL family Raf kinase inhibitor-like protein [Candidatus Saliniplasma sp.]